MSNVLLGSDTNTGEPVYLTAEGRQLSTYIIGAIGSGKSTLLEQIAIQDMQNGDGLCFLDPHDESVERILLHVPKDRKDDVIVWDPEDRPYPFGLNPFVCHDIEEVDRKAQDFIEALGSLKEFSEIFESAPVMKIILQNTTLAFILNQEMTLAEAPKFLENENYRKQFYSSIPREYEQVRDFWQNHDKKTDRDQGQIISSSLNKLQRFQSDRTMRSIFGQPTSSIDFRVAMDEGKIILVKLNSQWLGADNAAFVGAFIVYEIYRAARSRSDTPEHKRRQFHLIADEFQTYMTTIFPDLIEQVRKFNVDVTIAHQRRDQLPLNGRNAPLVAGNKVVFTVTGHDARELAKEFNIVIPEPTVIGQKEKYTFAPLPLTHLARHGHENRLVLGAYESVYRILNTLFSTMQNLISSYPDYLLGISNDMKFQEYGREKAAFEREVDSFLYAMMTAPSEEACRKYVPWDTSSLLGDSPGGVITGMAGHVRRDILAGYPFYIDSMYSVVLPKYGKLYAMRTQMWYERWVDILYELQCIVDSPEMTEEIDALLEKGHGDFVSDINTASDAQTELANRILFTTRSKEYWIKNVNYQCDPCSDTFDEYPTLKIKTSYMALSHDHSKEINAYYRWKWRKPESVSADGSEDWEIAEDLYQIESNLVQGLQSLGLLLYHYPCYTHTGQLEPIEDKPRLYSDVEAEIANSLSSLPRFAARCKLIQQGEPREYIIATHDRPAPEPYATQQAKDIREHSRSVYGRNRSEVEQEIARRLRDGPQRQPEAPVPASTEPEKIKQPTDFWETE